MIMKKMIIIPTSLFLFSLLLSPSFAIVPEFCIADYSSRQGPAGYACKDVKNVTAKDFVYSGLAARSDTANIVKSGISTAFYDTFPAVNGLGIALARADLDPSGVVPLHSHPRSTEILILIKGTLTSGIITSDNTVYLTTLKEGDVMVYPQGLLHFQVNSAKSPPATFFVGFNSENPGIQFTGFSLFANDLPTELVNANTFVSVAEIKRLKALFGVSG